MERRRQARIGFLIIAALVLAVAVLLTSAFSPPGQAGIGWGSSLGIALRILTTVIVLAASCLFLYFLLMQMSRWRASHGGYSLQIARECSGEVGREASLGPVKVYVYGGEDPTPMLQAQINTCRPRFESLVGESLPHDLPLRVVAFGRRNALVGFFRRIHFILGNHELVYLPWSTRTMALTTELPSFRLADLERAMRTALGYFLLDAYREASSAFWLQVGVGNVIACGGNAAELSRLNRKMLAALARGTSLGSAVIFHPEPRGLVWLVKDWQIFENFANYNQLFFQSWSVTEFLCGASAPNERRERFRRFVKDVRSRGQQEAFQRHFDFGFDKLLEEWRSWVLAQGIGDFGSTPPCIRTALLERVLPLIEDRHAKLIERTQAIREMGRMGFVLGADHLIDLLREADERLVPEIVWSLEAISGQTYGDDPDRWAAWWQSLPAGAVETTVAHPSEL
jgi:hypothetical protein